jgi:hypothetical protein
MVWPTGRLERSSSCLMYAGNKLHVTGEMETMVKKLATPQKSTEWMASYIKETKHASGNRAVAKRYREEFFIEYSTGQMASEKKALITGILGPSFFAPVDRFEVNCQRQAAYLARKVQEEAVG